MTGGGGSREEGGGKGEGDSAGAPVQPPRIWGRGERQAKKAGKEKRKKGKEGRRRGRKQSGMRRKTEADLSVNLRLHVYKGKTAWKGLVKQGYREDGGGG